MYFTVKLVLFYVIFKMTSADVHKFIEEGVVPDVLFQAPNALLKLDYNELNVEEGAVLKPSQVQNAPTASWAADKHAHYTLIMVDPDALSRKNPIFREFLHWLVVNIPGGDVTSGESLAAYRPSAPPPGTDLHRYVFLVYKQNDKLNFDEPRLDKTSRNERKNFSTAKFVDKYHLSSPVAGNFFLAQNEGQQKDKP